jgi:LysM repeat protein
VTYSEIVQKKVLGIPVLYLAAGFVTILAVVAWRMKATPDADTAGVNPEDATAGAEDEASNALAGMEASGAYSGYTTNGTVVVTPTPTASQDAEEQTNQKWLASAIDYVVNDAKIATVGQAQLALTKYLDGEDLSYDEGKIRDAALNKLKLPPEGVAKVGITSEAPAQKQFTAFPGKHTVKGNNDNTAALLAALYYGTGDALHRDRIVEYNTGLGPATTTYAAGTVVTIPPYTNPAYYTVTGKNGDTSVSVVAAKHGLSVSQIQGLNPDLTYPLKVGMKIRTQ